MNYKKLAQRIGNKNLKSILESLGCIDISGSLKEEFTNTFKTLGAKAPSEVKEYYEYFKSKLYWTVKEALYTYKEANGVDDSFTPVVKTKFMTLREGHGPLHKVFEVRPSLSDYTNMVSERIDMEQIANALRTQGYTVEVKKLYYRQILIVDFE
jgi:CHAD domain-containing protein